MNINDQLRWELGWSDDDTEAHFDWRVKVGLAKENHPVAKQRLGAIRFKGVRALLRGAR